MINFKTNRMMEAKSWRYFLMRHQYEIAQLKIAALKDRVTDGNQLISFLFSAYKDLFKGENKHPPRLQEGLERAKVAKPLNKRSLARHFTVRQVGGAWGREGEMKRSVARLERSISKNFIAEDEESRELDTDMPIRRMAKTITARFQSLDSRLQELLSQYDQHASQLHLIEQEIYSTHKKEMSQWNKLLNEVQTNYYKALEKKKEEIRRLNSTMAMWVHQYLDMEQRVVKGEDTDGKEREATAERLRRMMKIMEKQTYAQAAETAPTHVRRQSMPEVMRLIDRLPGDEDPSLDEDD